MAAFGSAHIRDPIAKIPEYKVCAIALEAVTDS
jgi:hypothetical protein